MTMALFTSCAISGCTQGQVQDLMLLGGPHYCPMHAQQAALRRRFQQSLGDQLPVEPTALRRLEFARQLARSGKVLG
jgi:hypothetical protein